METTQQYPSGNASLFSIAARKPEDETWFQCTHCMIRTDQKFIQYDGNNYKIYECPLCHTQNRKLAVR